MSNTDILKQHRLKLQRAIQDMVIIMGNEALNHFKKSFVNQGFTDEGLEKWKPRKGEITGGIAKLRSRERGARGILIGKGTGTLRRSLTKTPFGRYGMQGIIIGVNLPYANVHNEGLRAGRGQGFIMPKRQFVGYSGKLNRLLIDKFNNKIQQAFK